MALEVHSLASGSSGNSILVKDGRDAVLIDAGISMRRITRGLMSVGVNPADLSAILITHEHSDHVASAVQIAAKYGVPIVGNAPTLSAVGCAEHVRHKVMDAREELLVGNLLVRPFAISHDAACPVGYSISSSTATVCSATDTGVLTPEIRAEAMRADVLIIESNHDAEMLRTGPYPHHIKRRIASERGHLSNDATAGLLIDLADSGRDVAVWLAHLSKTNNTPATALTTAQYLLWSCLGTSLDMRVAARDVPSLSWRQADRPYQLALFERPLGDRPPPGEHLCAV